MQKAKTILLYTRLFVPSQHENANRCPQRTALCHVAAAHVGPLSVLRRALSGGLPPDRLQETGGAQQPHQQLPRQERGGAAAG